MRRKSVIIFSSIVLVLVCSGFIKKSIDIKSVQKQTQQHLSAKGYASSEYQIKVTYHMGNTLLGYSPYSIKVNYSNEPDVNYYYDYNSTSKEISQSGIAGMKDSESKDFKHAE